GRRSVVGDLHVAGSNARSLRGRARPRIGNVERAGLVVAGIRRGDGQGEGRGKDESDGAHFYPPDDVNERPRALRPTSTQRADRRRVRRTSEGRAIPAADAVAAMAARRAQTSDAPIARKTIPARRLGSPEGCPVHCRRRRDKPRNRLDLVPAQPGARRRNRPWRTREIGHSRDDPEPKRPKREVAARSRRPQPAPRICGSISPWRYPSAGCRNASRSTKRCRFASDGDQRLGAEPMVRFYTNVITTAGMSGQDWDAVAQWRALSAAA